MCNRVCFNNVIFLHFFIDNTALIAKLLYSHLQKPPASVFIKGSDPHSLH